MFSRFSRIAFRFLIRHRRYLSELLVAANESKMLKQQRRDAAIADDLRHLDHQELMGQSSPERLRDLMAKAKAQIEAEVVFCRVRALHSLDFDYMAGFG